MCGMLKEKLALKMKMLKAKVKDAYECYRRERSENWKAWREDRSRMPEDSIERYVWRRYAYELKVELKNKRVVN